MKTLLETIDTTNTKNTLGMSKTPISARIEQKILEDAKTVAKKENRSFNNLLETALIAYCKGKL